MKPGTILVGTIGQGVMMSRDEGESWTRASVGQGMHSDCIVKSLLADPRTPAWSTRAPTWASTRATTAAPRGAGSTPR